MRSDFDRFHPVADVIDRAPEPGCIAAYAKQTVRERPIKHREYITRHA